MLAFLNMGWPEMLVILIIALLIFGNRLPEVMRSLGKSVNEFKKGMGEMGDQIMTEQQPAQPPAATPPAAAPPAAAPAPAPAPPTTTASHTGAAPEDPSKKA